MFNDIAGRYDFLNHFLSFGVDKRWRKKVVTTVARHFQGRTEGLSFLDVATGTGDLAFALAALKPLRICGLDIAPAMMEIARKKAAERNLQGTIDFTEAPAESIPFPDHTFDAVTVAFGVRNFENLNAGIKEMLRVLKPGGLMLILEFSHPGNGLFRHLYLLYSKYFIPAAGRIFSGNSEAYRYLPESVAAFPSGPDFLSVMTSCGVKSAGQQPLTMGIASLYTGEK